MTFQDGIHKLIENCDRQLEFIEWLKKHDLYNPMEESATMQKMYDVWLLMREENIK